VFVPKEVPIANAVFTTFEKKKKKKTIYFYLVRSLRETGSLKDFFLPLNNIIVPKQ